MVDQKEEMDERLVEIKGYVRQAQLNTNLYEREEVNLEGIGMNIEETLGLALVAAKDVPPIEKMIEEVQDVWKLLWVGTDTIAKMEGHSIWLVGCIFSIVSAIDYLLEVDA